VGRSCESCHTAQAETYAASAHAHVFSNPLFQISWKHVAERAWCLTCHDPKGMTCGTCHDDLTRRVSNDTCARCHQFHAPEERYAKLPMQDTVGEWRRSGSDKSCIDCHFAGGDHRSRGGHDLELLQRTLSVQWSADCATVKATGAGHAVPTGDPFHVMRLSLCADAACKVRLESKNLARTTLLTADGMSRPAADTRPQPEAKLCFGSGRAKHWILEVRHAEAALGADVPAGELWRLIHAGPR
jgi:hypothetical protein